MLEAEQKTAQSLAEQLSKKTQEVELFGDKHMTLLRRVVTVEDEKAQAFQETTHRLDQLHQYEERSQKLEAMLECEANERSQREEDAREKEAEVRSLWAKNSKLQKAAQDEETKRQRLEAAERDQAPAECDQEKE